MAVEQALESRYVEVVLDQSAVKVHYHDLGNLRSDLPPIVMLHGSGPAACGAHNFSQNVGHFIDLGFRVILLDWPGWGKSDSLVSKGSRSSLNAQVLRRVLDGLGIDRPVHIVGNSMGAHSATIFAIENPGRVSKLVLIGGGNGGRGLFQAAPTEGIQKIIAFYQHPSLERMRDLLSTVIYRRGLISDETVQSRFEAAMMRTDHIENYCKSIHVNPMQYPDVSARLPEIDVPTLIFWGQDDRVVPLDLGLRVATLIPDADMHIFSQCGHVPHMEQASKFNLLASWFLNDRTGQT
ncbi:alpha/beta fold hydrolase [Candidimonas sp. SYP-B2681]|uniref:alpha/beta fold hydrolase n=1 Tax=Candidimonas sp. SYP-B2681 TaxID=2497686 RepID=UPI000F8638A9|nr:alpha/beta hydrolase [Candidimonas sp. SYP-B2681]RTZ45515.1 alpha/beta fold hydrolase [Candidimonas sp. SYP-B2681]